METNTVLTLIGWALGCFVPVIVYIFRLLIVTRNELHDFKVEVAKDYMPREETQQFMQRLEEKLDRLLDFQLKKNYLVINC